MANSTIHTTNSSQKIGTLRIYNTFDDVYNLLYNKLEEQHETNLAKQMATVEAQKEIIKISNSIYNAKIELDKIEFEKAELERIEKERLAKEEAEKIAAEKAEAERFAKEEANRLEKQKTEEYYLNYSSYRVVIPGLVDLPMRYCTISESQNIIDSGTVAIFWYDKLHYIAAHKHLGLESMKQSIPNKTYAYIDGKKYICEANFVGYNNETELIDNNGNKVTYDGFIMYTCNDSWQNVTITFWKEIV